MVLEWDKNKNKINIKKHGIDFLDAHKIFEKPILTKIDDRIDYKEKRWIGLGQLEHITVVLVYTKRGKNIRIISIRKANKIERKVYNEYCQQNQF
jgi:uncharacterized DUF497 family protein